MVIFNFLARNTIFDENCLKISKLLFETEILYPNQFEDAKLSGAVHFFCHREKVPILGKFGSKIRNCSSEIRCLN